MQLIVDNNPGQIASESVVTIGNFDGVHVGHMALINRCLALTGAGQKSSMVTFDPLPLAYFRPENAPARLTSNAHKEQLVGESGMDLMWRMRFNRALAELRPEQFARDLLVNALGARVVVVGDDFRFGHARSGDTALLALLGEQLGFTVEVMGEVRVNDVRVSSSTIREALAEGDLATANSYLGRPFSMLGTVQKGQQLGRTLGFPTANLAIEDGPSPVAGVFAVMCELEDGSRRPGVANLGTRPVVNGSDFLLEAHLFDYSGDLYGQKMEVVLVERLRDELDFDGLEAMVTQMKADASKARNILAKQTD